MLAASTKMKAKELEVLEEDGFRFKRRRTLAEQDVGLPEEVLPEQNQAPAGALADTRGLPLSSTPEATAEDKKGPGGLIVVDKEAAHTSPQDVPQEPPSTVVITQGRQDDDQEPAGLAACPADGSHRNSNGESMEMDGNSGGGIPAGAAAPSAGVVEVSPSAGVVSSSAVAVSAGVGGVLAGAVAVSGGGGGVSAAAAAVSAGGRGVSAGAVAVSGGAVAVSASGGGAANSGLMAEFLASSEQPQLSLPVGSASEREHFDELCLAVCKANVNHAAASLRGQRVLVTRAEAMLKEFVGEVQAMLRVTSSAASKEETVHATQDDGIVDLAACQERNKGVLESLKQQFTDEIAKWEQLLGGAQDGSQVAAVPALPPSTTGATPPTADAEEMVPSPTSVLSKSVQATHRHLTLQADSLDMIREQAEDLCARAEAVADALGQDFHEDLFSIFPNIQSPRTIIRRLTELPPPTT